MGDGVQQTYPHLIRWSPEPWWNLTAQKIGERTLALRGKDRMSRDVPKCCLCLRKQNAEGKMVPRSWGKWWAGLGDLTISPSIRPHPCVTPGQPSAAMAAYGQTQYSAGIQQAPPYTAYPPPAQAYGIPPYSEYQASPCTPWQPQQCGPFMPQFRIISVAGLILAWR